MSNIEFGIGLRRLDSVAEDAKIAEDLGYTYLCTGEHVFFYGPINNDMGHVNSLGRKFSI